jgi:alkanesulfonate monooxygenase SsuD/methylene tetrahydromethanopterin reductase-like flavin-dependent oxidoreductase (luciferase family)
MAPDNRPGSAVALAGSTARRLDGRWARDPMTFEDVADAVALAEETGYGSVWVPDHGVWDPFTLLGALAPRTERIGLATGVVTLAERRPAEISAAALTLDRASGGRAVLGVGSGPQRKVAEVADGLDEVRRSVGRAVPLYLAALGPAMAELAGRAADGVLLTWCPPRRVERARGEVARGADAAGRDPAEVTVAVYVRACLGHDDEHALAALGDAADMYAAIPAYRRQLEAEGVEPSPEAMARDVCVWGDRDGALERLAVWRDAGADLVVVYPVPAQEPVSSLMGTIMAAAPDPAVER